VAGKPVDFTENTVEENRVLPALPNPIQIFYEPACPFLIPLLHKTE
jgi:hypothetical protein